jgi:hypothetical protein
VPVISYIDPGTGSALLYVVTGVFVALYFAARGLYYRVAEQIFRDRHKRQKCTLAIHCEDPRYEITFLPVLRFLVEHQKDITFFTMYPRDDSFETLPPGVDHCEIAPGMVGYAHLNHLEAKVLVTTTPQLDVMTFRRSKRVKHYSMMQHALGESRYVRPYAYDFFDSVLCCGEIVKQNIRRIEEIRGLPQKQLLETGIPHWDELRKHVAQGEREPRQRPLILIAPSWGPFSIFQAFGTGVVEKVATKYDVVVRPHPQMKISQPEIYAKILALEGVSVDTSRTPGEVMARADLLISDISGIMHEFAFIHEKPVIIVDHKVAMSGLEGELLGGESELKQRCREFIVPILPSEMDGVLEAIDKALREHSRERIVEVREKTVYNFGHASEVAAAQIREIIECQ